MVVQGILLSYFFADKGTSTAIMISEITVLIINLYYVKKLRSGLKMFDWQSALQAIGGILLFFPAIYVIDEISSDQLVQLVFSIFICICFYFSFLFIVKNDLMKNLFRSMKRIV